MLILLSWLRFSFIHERTGQDSPFKWSTHMKRAVHKKYSAHKWLSAATEWICERASTCESNWFSTYVQQGDLLRSIAKELLLSSWSKIFVNNYRIAFTSLVFWCVKRNVNSELLPWFCLPLYFYWLNSPTWYRLFWRYSGKLNYLTREVFGFHLKPRWSINGLGDHWTTFLHNR